MGLHGLYATDSHHVWVAGIETGASLGYPKSTIFFFDGIEWSEQYSINSESINDIYTLDESHIWAVGATSGGIYFGTRK